MSISSWLQIAAFQTQKYPSAYLPSHLGSLVIWNNERYGIAGMHMQGCLMGI